MDYSKEHIKSLSKGLAVLVAVNEMAPVRVSSLVEQTGLPKPTLIRILNTLVAEGYLVSRPREEGGGYTPTPKVRLLSSAFAEGTLLTQVAQPVLHNLCEMTKWPTDLLVRDGVSMVIEASNRLVAPIGLKRFEQKRFPIINSSSGHAYLASLPEVESQEVITSALAHGMPGGAARVTELQVSASIEEAREQGYVTWEYDAPIQGTRVYSLSVVDRGLPIAVLTLITLRDVVARETFEAELLPEMREAAAQIAEGVSRHRTAF